MMPTVRALVATVAATASMILAACGIGGGSDTLSRDQLIARGDAICRDGRGAFRSIQATPPKSAKQAAAQTKKLIATAEAEIKQLRALRAPDELRAPLDTYLAARTEGVGLLREAQVAAARNDPQGYVNANKKLRQGQAKRYDLARKVGFSVCSNPKAAEG
jgi:hypothetical protein